MPLSVMTGLLSKATTGNELLSILDSIVVDETPVIGAVIPTAEPINFWVLRLPFHLNSWLCLSLLISPLFGLPLLKT